MSVHYLIDGYNAVYQIPNLLRGSLQESRESLVRLVEQDCPQGSSRNLVTIVFDGQPGVGINAYAVAPKILFTENETADEAIKKIVERADLKKNIIVVTDDKEIQFYVRQFGAKVLAVKDFFLRKPGKKKKDFQRSITNTEECQINQELKKVWLKKGE
ncbi:MAG: NYN domain-containing protein [Candidatus Omnitrophica bacterium]|nr:NYN domain-containing protein [Candidatus Omnitrophota bacterium]